MNIQREKGVALILVLWVLVLLTTIAGTITTTVRSDIQMSKNLVDEVKGRALVDAGFNYLLAKYVSKGVAAADDVFPPDGLLREWQFQGYKLHIGLKGESAKINLNLADEDLLLNAFLAVGVEQDAAESLRDQVMDWRDVDQDHRLHGAEDPEYEAAGFTYGAADKAFESVDELALLLDMKRGVFEKVKPLFTIDSSAKTVNPKYAEEGVLMAIPGVDPGVVQQFIEDRNLADPGLGLPDFPFADKRYLSTNETGVYRLYSQAEMADGHKISGEMVVDLRSRGRLRYQVLEVGYNSQNFPQQVVISDRKS